MSLIELHRRLEEHERSRRLRTPYFVAALAVPVLIEHLFRRLQRRSDRD